MQLVNKIVSLGQILGLEVDGADGAGGVSAGAQ